MTEIQSGFSNEAEYLKPYFREQEDLIQKISTTNELPQTIKYVAGVDVAYNEEENKMVGAVVVLDAETLEVVEQAYHFMEIVFPYVPGLFSFREIPPLLKAIEKLEIKPDLIVCDGHGIAHPKGVGLASHLGVKLDIPTIGCAKKRLVGVYDKSKVGLERGSVQDLILEDKVIGIALRTQEDVKPMFVSIGHKVNLETAKKWTLKLCSKYRLPETTRQSDHVVNSLLKADNDSILPDNEG